MLLMAAESERHGPMPLWTAEMILIKPRSLSIWQLANRPSNGSMPEALQERRRSRLPPIQSPFLSTPTPVTDVASPCYRNSPHINAASRGRDAQSSGAGHGSRREFAMSTNQTRSFVARNARLWREEPAGSRTAMTLYLCASRWMTACWGAAKERR